MRIYTWIPLIMLLAFPLEASKGGCTLTIEQGATGMNGATGAAGATGPAGAGGPIKNDPHLSVKAATQIVLAGTALVFSSELASSGTAISWDGASTFTFKETGDYLVSFVYYTTHQNLPILSPGFQLYVNGVPVGINAPFFSNFGEPTTGVLNEIIRITSANSTAKVINKDSHRIHIGFENAAATINFIQLTTP